MSRCDAKLFILVADDSAFMRQKTGNAIASQAVRIEEAVDGLEAVAVYRRAVRDGRVPDAVVMDITMPNMNGIEATREILNMDPNARIIISSAIGQDGIIRECIDLGALEYLVKPYRLERLKSILQDIISSPAALEVLNRMAV